jgi:hypothetical protein
VSIANTAPGKFDCPSQPITCCCGVPVGLSQAARLSQEKAKYEAKAIQVGRESSMRAALEGHNVLFAELTKGESGPRITG